ncbi:DUF5689 domain-containing protein [Olleya sp. R77988]|uniref:DUF5689 domain-containing protein n=1 Tax=Olleya sp. R77988 TaxID=3093875 RepID=UPI0037CC5D44
MKTNKLITLALSFMALIAVTSCVENDDYSVPQTQGSEENAGLNSLLAKIQSGEVELQTMTQVKANFVQYEATQFETEIAVKGYVSSSDQTGNFYKEFFIQDSPTDPTQTLKVVLNQSDTYNQFNKGREVYIYLKDLYIGETNTGDDVVTIGGKFDTFDNDVLEMTSNQIPNHLFRSSTTETLVPVELNLSDVSEAHIGMFVKLMDVQFPASLENKPYVDPTDDYDSQRAIESCSDSSTFTLESSTFASFKNLVIPTDGKGSISGIVNKTYDGYDLIINLNTTDDVVMDGLRCDPLFQDSFSAGNLDKWTPYSVTGTQEWYYNTFGNPNDSATMSGFSGGAQTNEDWLISLPIDLSSVPSAFLTFQTVKRYNGNDIEVFYATDYAGGDPNTDGTWVALPATLDTNSGSWSSWTDSGVLDVSAAAGGNLFIAIKYTSDSSSAATWEVDNVKITAE